MEIEYKTNVKLSPGQFIDILERSTLAARRPVDELRIIEAMLEHADLLVTAWQGEKLVGVARSLTDFSYCCYLSDLAVDREIQRAGIGLGLIKATQKALGPRCTIILLSAPDAVDYYPRIGFDHHPQAWILPPGKKVTR
jgi:predicted N-acetyltransferase YhbS